MSTTNHITCIVNIMQKKRTTKEKDEIDNRQFNWHIKSIS